MKVSLVSSAIFSYFSFFDKQIQQASPIESMQAEKPYIEKMSSLLVC
jgi:hypothetical protein